MNNKCLNCGKSISANKKYCNLSCAASHREKVKKQKILNDYLDNPNKCLNCGEPILPKEGQRLSDVKVKKFCCSSCAAQYNNKKYPKKQAKNKFNKCLNCGKEFDTVKYNKKYCSSSCQAEHKYKQYIEEWKLGLQNGLSGKYQTSDYIRRYLFEKYDNKCCRCGWSEINPTSGRIPLQIHHVDGNYKNNSEDNLELLCPNCHALTPTFGALNRGKGRDGRYDKK